MRSTAVSISYLVGNGAKFERISMSWTPGTTYRVSSHMTSVWRKFRYNWNTMGNNSSNCGFWFIRNAARRRIYSLWKISIRFLKYRAVHRRSAMSTASLFSMCKRHVGRTIWQQLKRKYGG